MNEELSKIFSWILNLRVRLKICLSYGSAREIFDFSDMCEVKIPIPSLEVQQSIVNIYNTYNERKAINETLKSQIKAICPVLIKGSLGEAVN